MKLSKKLNKIWNGLPVDYYEKGIRNNLGQRLWHGTKKRIFKELFNHIKKEAGLDINDKNLNIIDLGCADGHLTNWYKTLWPNSNVWGIDVVPKLIKAGKKKYPKVNFVKADLHLLPFPKNKFDIAICSEVLEHVVDPNKVIREIKRVLKKDGYLIIELDTGNWLFSLLWFFWTEFGKGRVWKEAHLHQFDSKSLPKIIENNSLIIIKKLIHHLGMATTVMAKK